MKSRLLLLLFTVIASTANAEIPAGYYTSLNGKSEAQLKDACYRVIRNLTRISSYQNLPQYFRYTDVYPNSDRWWDMYSDIPLFAPSFSGLNREHSFPKSWWGGLQDVNAYTDLNHLYPAEMAANQAKSNYPLGTVDRAKAVKFDNSMSLVGVPVSGQGGWAKYVFEPDDEYKGDFARTYFYMVTCYQDYNWHPSYMYMLQQNTYPTLSPWAIDLLLQWSRQDPVSQKEIDRNEVVYGYQSNRNPFIDLPELAEYIWGNKRGETFNLEGSDPGNPEPPTGPALLAPTRDMTLDLGQVALGRKVTSQLFFRGQQLSGDISVRLYAEDRAMFSIPVNSIAATLVNGVDGYWLNVTYNPTRLGRHNTRLLVSGAGIQGTVSVNITGECLPVPDLVACEAIEATDITSDTYTANWIDGEGNDADYFIVTRTIYLNGDVRQVQAVAEECMLTVDDFGESDKESYYVRASRLGYESDPSNVIFVYHSGIHGIDADEPLMVLDLDGAIRFVCSAPHTGVSIYDVTGRLMMYISEVDNNTEIILPRGGYVITTDQCHIPQKVLVR